MCVSRLAASRRRSIDAGLGRSGRRFGDEARSRFQSGNELNRARIEPRRGATCGGSNGVKAGRWF